MDVPCVISRSAWEPDKAIKREEFGQLSEGAVEDVAILFY
ncbi:hypothetical protein SAMN05421813_11087 [Daejeonella rubra]|uniref:Uncharacterized protein n=1 Tax=Daejeonella rubra TaxID=990371 RepID=A0A1G9SJV0_9SPHI|nr:hypothetical protein SAMN05421813_11087 [Daejeonella rubra]